MRDTHPVHGIPVLYSYAEWSLVFLSFRSMLFRVEKDYFKLTNNDNESTLFSPHFRYICPNIAMMILFASLIGIVVPLNYIVAPLCDI